MGFLLQGYLRDYTSNPSYTWDSSGLSGQQQIQVLSRKPGTDDQAVSASRRYPVN